MKRLFIGILLITGMLSCGEKNDPVTLASLIDEMVSYEMPATFPLTGYQSLQSSSYNRRSVSPDSAGWFADSDGICFIRTEEINGKTEWVIMEHDGPGCITRIWTPFFYYNFNNRTGPDIRFYLDDNPEPAIDCNFIGLVTGKEFVKPPFAGYTARAGDLYLPIPFAKSCKITLTEKSFYYIVNYRAYEPNVPVQTFSMEENIRQSARIKSAGEQLLSTPEITQTGKSLFEGTVSGGESREITLSKGAQAVNRLIIRMPEATPQQLRSTVLRMTCDDEETIWCPVGSLFGVADRVHYFKTYYMEVNVNGDMILKWKMPYRENAKITVDNLNMDAIDVSITASVSPYRWTEQSMYFHVNWRYVPPTPCYPLWDMNFIEIEGTGNYVGDILTVLNPVPYWWGEGDEKIYVDEDIERRFPTHFGTGTEDYYGWAGGVVPKLEDEFSTPFLANIRVSDNNTMGYNICTRQRSLDDIPFRKRLKVDMEASTGDFDGLYSKNDFMHYTITTFWYARPGARHNRLPDETSAKLPLLKYQDLHALKEQLMSNSF